MAEEIIYVSEENLSELASKLTDKYKEDIFATKSQAGSPTPITVPADFDTIASSGDKTRTYVYLGLTSSGYIYGHLYYWQNDSWVDGGLVIAPNPTLTGDETILSSINIYGTNYRLKEKEVVTVSDIKAIPSRYIGNLSTGDDVIESTNVIWRTLYTVSYTSPLERRLINITPSQITSVYYFRSVDDWHYSSTTVFRAIDKQNTLVSGTNIKTINGNDILGSGNLVINDLQGIGPYSLQQNADDSIEHVKGGTALGSSSVALGLGDTYEQEFNILDVDPARMWMNGSANPNWQNMVLVYNNEYRRIIQVTGNTIIIDSPFSVISGTITARIITQVACGDSSLVFGEYSQAFGTGSLAGGSGCKAVGDHSFAGGYYSLTNQSNSIAFGYYSIAAGVGQAVFGKYNNINFDDLLIVGNGSNGALSDAFIVRADGRATVAHDPTALLDVATKGYVDTGDKLYGHHIVLKAFQVDGVDTVEMHMILKTKRSTAYDETALYNYFTQGQTLPNDTYVYTLGNDNANSSYYLGVRSGGFRMYRHDLSNQIISRSVLTSFVDTLFEISNL